MRLGSSPTSRHPNARRAEIIAGIKRAIEARGPSTDVLGGEGHALQGGAVPSAVMMSYLANAGMADEGAAVPFLEYCVHQLELNRTSPSLYGGFVGTAWAVRHVAHEVDTAEIDDSLMSVLETSTWLGDFDLISGLVGVGMYCIDCPVIAAPCLDAIVRHLSALAHWTGTSCTWLRPAAWLSEGGRIEHPNGYYDLGVAHGVAGVIAILSCALRSNPTAECRRLLDGAVSWLLAQSSSDGFRFPYMVGPDGRKGNGRGGWCNGDLGISMTLLAAASATGNADLHSDAMAIAKNCLSVHALERPRYDPGLCHGTAGIAHLAMRLFNYSKDEFFREKATYWIDVTMNKYRASLEHGGFAFMYGGADGGGARLIPSYGFLTGVAGVGLMLLAATCANEPCWDRLLVCS